MARAIRSAHLRAADVRLCLCGCGRILAGAQVMAGAACRKRMERRRKRDLVTALFDHRATVAAVTARGPEEVTPGVFERYGDVMD